MHSSNETSFARVNQIAALSARLAQDIGALRSGFSAGALVAEVVGRALGELERIGAQAGAGPLDCLDPAQTEQLGRLAQHYTMQKERDVHESVTRGSAIAAAPPN